MRKYLKSFLTVLSLSIVFLVVFAESSSVAKPEGTTKTVKIDKKKAIYDESLGKYVTPLKEVDGQLVPASTEEYETQNSKGGEVETEGLYTDDSDGGFTTMDYYEYWKYYPATISKVTGSTRKVTADIGCTTTSCSISKAVSVTISASYSVSASSERSAIKANAGFTWTSSASDTSTYSFTLSKGDTGYIGFKPYLKKTSGTLKSIQTGMDICIVNQLTLIFQEKLLRVKLMVITTSYIID
ncbi:hypothetical protein [Metabacillus sediminilitoris]|uniref:Uncharacterized protein n=1 Tax=Metabacillus sediminilitoris TaxID=2567941 RepID=A0A4S4BRU9_9BACI|nr:hypothetical protein [Metabacillus sediminilitoris]QGQ45444.1 hypothetical protein GMB29_09375 [Metabacillus sediminilitoris]THF77699.1 hypothetical protein E6W99_18555 [Metabacillus sediminilitoris]